MDGHSEPLAQMKKLELKNSQHCPGTLELEIQVPHMASVWAPCQPAATLKAR